MSSVPGEDQLIALQPMNTILLPEWLMHLSPTRRGHRFAGTYETIRASRSYTMFQSRLSQLNALSHELQGPHAHLHVQALREGITNPN